jgi:hypothetical protein
MHADRVEVSWDASKSSWLLRIETGEEVILRHCTLSKKTVADEGYELDPATLVRR